MAKVINHEPPDVGIESPTVRAAYDELLARQAAEAEAEIEL